MLIFFVSCFGLLPIFVFFSVFHELLFFLNFYLDFLFFLVTVFSPVWNTEPRQKLVVGQVMSLICWRVDSHRGLVQALEGAEEVAFLFTIVVLVQKLHKG